MRIITCVVCKREFYESNFREICGTECLGKYKKEHGKKWSAKN